MPVDSLELSSPVPTQAMYEIFNEVRAEIERGELIPQGGHVIVGFSGGADSSCLLHILNALRREHSFGLSAVHVNHHMRAEESDADAEYCAAFCRARGIPFVLADADIPALVYARKQTPEEAGRAARYTAFGDAARVLMAKEGLCAREICVALAHNRDDQVETVIMRILRGTGIDGLAAMPVRRTGDTDAREFPFDVIRPLINTPRTAIERYCSENGIEARRDSTNKQPVYMRNRIRLQLLRLLEEEYNPAIADALLRLQVSAAEDKDYFETLTTRMIEESCVFTRSGAQLPLRVLAEAHPALRHRLITGIFRHIGLAQDIASTHLAAADMLIARGQTGKSADFPSGYTFAISYEDAMFSAPDEEPDYEISNKPSAPKTRARLFTETLSPDQAAPRPAGPNAIDLDADKLSAAGSPVLRTRQAGDRISPQGMSGSTKIQDIFVDRKITRAERERIPLLALGAEILLIPGIRKSRLYAPDANTVKICRFTIVYDTGQ